MDRRQFILNKESVIENITQKLSDLTKHPGHDKYHVMRVHSLAKRICESEPGKADCFVVELSSLLHDIGHEKKVSGKKDDHELESAKRAAEILETYGIDAERIAKVKYCIEAHRASKKIIAETIEAKILQDADRLDALGAIVIARTFAYDPNRPIYEPSIEPKGIYDGISASSYNHLVEKILKLKPDTFNTRIAKEIAVSRLAFVELFVKEFIAEWNGVK